QLEYPEVGGVAIEVDAGVLRGAGGLLVGGKQRVLERRHQRVGVDSLLLFEDLDGLDDLATHGLTSSATRFERRIAVSGIVRSRSGSRSETAASSAARRVPVKLRWPSIGSRVRTRARRPRKRRKCSGLVSGRSAPGEETSSE